MTIEKREAESQNRIMSGRGLSYPYNYKILIVLLFRKLVIETSTKEFYEYNTRTYSGEISVNQNSILDIQIIPTTSTYLSVGSLIKLPYL